MINDSLFAITQLIPGKRALAMVDQNRANISSLENACSYIVMLATEFKQQIVLWEIIKIEYSSSYFFAFLCELEVEIDHEGKKDVIFTGTLKIKDHVFIKIQAKAKIIQLESADSARNRLNKLMQQNPELFEPKKPVPWWEKASLPNERPEEYCVDYEYLNGLITGFTFIAKKFPRLYDHQPFYPVTDLLSKVHGAISLYVFNYDDLSEYNIKSASVTEVTNFIHFDEEVNVKLHITNLEGNDYICKARCFVNHQQISLIQVWMEWDISSFNA